MEAVIKKAIAYKRISDADQSQYSLENQEDFVSKEALRQGYELVKIFEDNGFSAKTLNRPALTEMLEFCRKNKNTISSLFIYKFDRLSRDTCDFLILKRKLSEYGVRVISATEPAEDNASGEFLSTILSAVAKLDNQMRGQRTLEGMKKRFENGWITRAPWGYINILNDEGRKIIVKDPKTFSILQRAWEELGTGTQTLLSITRYLKRLGLSIPNQSVYRLFRNPFYMGIITSKRWILERRGNHEPMISEELFFRVQAVIDGRAITTKTKERNNPLFPLRGIAKCGTCLAPLTGAWSQGATKKYAYYNCSKRTHKMQAIPKDKLEGALVDLLKTITPEPEVRKLFIANVKAKWHTRHAEFKQQQAFIEADIKELEKQKETLVTKNITGVIDDETYKTFYEKVKDQILVKKTIQHESSFAQIDIETLCNFMDAFLNDLSKPWLHGTLEQQQLLISSIFLEELIWDGNAYRTSKINQNFLPNQSNQEYASTDLPLSSPYNNQFELLLGNYNQLMHVFQPLYQPAYAY